MSDKIARIVVVCRGAIVDACVGRERYTLNELLEQFDAQVTEITQSEGPSKAKLLHHRMWATAQSIKECWVAIEQIRLEHGAKFPWDAPDKWWEGDGTNPPPPRDWAHAAARGIIADLSDRRGIKYEFKNVDIDEDIRAELVETMASIIRFAETQRQE